MGMESGLGTGEQSSLPQHTHMSVPPAPPHPALEPHIQCIAKSAKLEWSPADQSGLVLTASDLLVRLFHLQSRGRPPSPRGCAIQHPCGLY
eukprot:3397369-Rhodomonas_salina.2